MFAFCFRYVHSSLHFTGRILLLQCCASHRNPQHFCFVRDLAIGCPRTTRWYSLMRLPENVPLETILGGHRSAFVGSWAKQQLPFNRVTDFISMQAYFLLICMKNLGRIFHRSSCCKSCKQHQHVCLVLLTCLSDWLQIPWLLCYSIYWVQREHKTKVLRGWG